MSELDERDEYRALVGGVRSLLEQLVESGADLLPAGERVASKNIDMTPEPHAAPAPPPPSRVREEPPPSFEPSRRSPPRSAPAPASQAQPPSEPPPSLPPPSSRKLHVLSPLPPPSARVLAAQTMDEVARRVRLEELQQEVAACQACVLGKTRTQTVFARGNPNAEVMFVGEGPGADEDAQGFPFVGKAGQLLDKMIAAMGYARDDVYVANIVKCRPPENRKPVPEEMEACEGYLHEQIALVRPKVIVALGATAVEGLLRTTGITKLRGTWRLYRGEIPVMPTFHPSYLLRVPNAKREVWEDLKQVMAKVGKKPNPS